MANKKTGIIMGSNSDLETMKEAINMLKEVEVDFDVNIISAHRSPERAHAYAIEAEKKYEVIIAAAGGSAHLAGVIASLPPIPVLGIPRPHIVKLVGRTSFDNKCLTSTIPVPTMGI